MVRDREQQQKHTVNDGTNDLVNLSGISSTSLRAGESGQRRKAVGSERLESATSDGGGRTSKSSPPEGPGETTRKARSVSREEIRGDGGGVVKRGFKGRAGGKDGLEGGKEEKEKHQN